MATIHQTRQPSPIQDKFLRHSNEHFRRQQPIQQTPGHTYTLYHSYIRRHQLRPIRHRERKKSLTREHVKDIGSAKGIQSYRGQGYEGAIAGKLFCDFPVPPSLRDGCALRGACRARLVNIYGGPLLLGGLAMRRGWDLVWSATIPSR